MTDLRSTPADHAAILGWTNRTYTSDEITAWNTYRNTPPNDEWAGMDNREPRNDMSTFAAGMRAARTSPDPLNRIADTLEDLVNFHRGIKVTR